MDTIKLLATPTGPSHHPSRSDHSGGVLEDQIWTGCLLLAGGAEQPLCYIYMRLHLGGLRSERFTCRDPLQLDACRFLYREMLRTAS
jgi:hypothetical protein